MTVLAATGLAAGGLLAIVGLPPVDLHGPLHQVGVMTPTCGATRALRLTFLGDLSGAFAYNPLSPLLVAGAVAVVGRHLVGLCIGRWLTVRVPRNRATVALTVVAVVLLTVRQQEYAELLMTSA